MIVKCVCGQDFENTVGKGQIKQYCSDRCRQRAKRSRDKSKDSRDTVIVQDKAVTTNVTPIKPILKYPGAKWRLAEWIVSYFPQHKHYVEPYCGSAACFFNKAPAAHEVLNDLNGSIVNLFTVIRDRGEELIRAIEMTPWAEGEYLSVEKNYTDGDEVEQARRFLVRCWQAHGVRITSTSGWRHNGMNGSAYPVRLWKLLPERLLITIDRLRDAEIRSRPALEVIDYYNAPDVLLYVDPPYILSTRNSKFYSHEMTDGEHMALLDKLDEHKGSVILSGYAHPIYDERLSHWQRITAPAVAEHGQARTEVLWVNDRVQRRQLNLFDEVV